MDARVAWRLSTVAAMFALWAESALLAWWLDPPTSGTGYLAASAGGTLAAALVLMPGHEGSPSSWTATTWIGVFFMGLAFSVAFVEMDCHGTLALIDGHPTCALARGNITLTLTCAVMAVTTTALPAALRAWLRRRLVRSPA